MSTLGNNLDKINKELEGVNDYLDKVVSDFDKKSQAYVDAKWAAINTEIEAKLNKIKDIKIVPPLHAQYEHALAIIALLGPLMDFLTALTSLNPTNLDSVISALNTIIDGLKKTLAVIIAPYQPAIDFGLEIVPKVEELGENLVEVATYQPPTIEGVEIPPLDINISLTMDDIING